MPHRRHSPRRPELVAALAALSLTGCSLLTFGELQFDLESDSAAPSPYVPDGGPVPPPAEPDGSLPLTDAASPLPFADTQPLWLIGSRQAFAVLPSPCLRVERPAYVRLTPNSEPTESTCPWPVEPVSLTLIDPSAWSFDPESCAVGLTIRLGSTSNGNTYTVTGAYISATQVEGTLDFAHNEPGLACRVTVDVSLEHEVR